MYRVTRSRAAIELIHKPVMNNLLMYASTIHHVVVHHHRDVHQPPRYPYLGYVSRHAG